MSGPMYFNPTPEQVAASRASTCGLATPKDPKDCGRYCDHYAVNKGPCQFYRARVVEKLAEDAMKARFIAIGKETPDLDKAVSDYLSLPKLTR
jgi:hypothetical protein